MCLEASQYFDEALKHKKGSKKYKTAVRNGLKYLGYALHPIQDIYAHTPDRCHRARVPHLYNYKDINGQMQVGVYFVMGWSHLQDNDITDSVLDRPQQAEKTRKHTIKILKVFMEEYETILTRDNGVKL